MGEKLEVQLTKQIDIIDPNRIPHILAKGEVGIVLEAFLSDTKTGKVLKQFGTKKCESFVRQFTDILWTRFNSRDDIVAPYQIRDTGNTLRDAHIDGTTQGGMYAGATTGDTNYGILVGTGVTPPAITDYMMETLIADGTGAGQLQYGGVAFGSPSSDATTSQFTVTRNFANGSDAPVVVTEAGLAVRIYDSTSTTRYILIVHDAVSYSIPDGQTLTLNYRIQASI